MDWDDLKIVHAVARHGSLSAAARALGSTQPTISRRLSAFEQRLGVQIFERRAGAVRPGPLFDILLECLDGMDDFYGINCSHPLEFEPALEPGDWILRLRSLRPNASAKDKVDLCQLGHIEDGDPVDLGRRIGALAQRYPHIDIFGSCCGTWAPHLDEMARNIRQAPH